MVHRRGTLQASPVVATQEQAREIATTSASPVAATQQPGSNTEGFYTNLLEHDKEMYILARQSLVVVFGFPLC